MFLLWAPTGNIFDVTSRYQEFITSFQQRVVGFGFLEFSSSTQPDLIDDVTLSVTPLPATLPLFATGLGALGLLAWRRKRAAVHFQ
jgi:hypothetical protein